MNKAVMSPGCRLGRTHQKDIDKWSLLCFGKQGRATSNLLDLWALKLFWGTLDLTRTPEKTTAQVRESLHVQTSTARKSDFPGGS